MNQTSTLLINLTTETDPFDWVLQFESPNYIAALTMKTDTVDPLSSPYEVNSTNNLTVEITLRSGVLGAMEHF
ncbi:MAG: hypothetical protein ACXAC7_17065 [Candidatus Hodarchaeales archaeon]|jgi:hypothetical protein